MLSLLVCSSTSRYSSLIAARFVALPTFVNSFRWQPAVNAPRLLKSTLTEQSLPTPPSRPQTAYFEFLKEKRLLLKNENPEMKLTDLARAAGSLWRSLPLDQKQAFIKKAEDNKAEYKKKYKEFMDSLSDTQKLQVIANEAMKTEERKVHKQKLKKRRHRKTLNKLEKPKGSPTSFALFVKQCQHERGNASVSDYMKQVSEMWKKLSDDAKQKYNAEAKALHAAYEVELGKWEQKMLNAGITDVVRKHKVPKKAVDSKDSAKKMTTKKSTKVPTAAATKLIESIAKQSSTTPKTKKTVTSVAKSKSAKPVTSKAKKAAKGSATATVHDIWDSSKSEPDE